MPQTNPQIERSQNIAANSPIRNDYNIKTPMAYTKLEDIELPYGTKAHCYKLANGQKVIIAPQEGETVLRTYVNTGSMNEPDSIRGISHYIEHNLFNGSKGLEEGDFFKQVDKMGASTNASTGFAETNYYISSNLLTEGDLAKKIQLHASMLETPLFAVEKLEKEKNIVNSEINMITSNPDNIAVNKMLKNLYGIKTTSTDMIGGTTDNITNLNQQVVKDYFNNNYYPANMVTVVTGEVDPEETIKLIAKNFTSKKQPPQQRYFEKLTPIQKSIREDIISDKATATTMIVGFNGPASNNSKDRIYSEALLILLATGPAARINTKVKTLHTSAFAEDEKISSNPNDGRVLMFMSDGTEENSEKILKSMFNEIGNIANNPPTESEMKAIKKMMLKSFSNIFENTFISNAAIGEFMLEQNKDYLNNFEQIVNSMTAQDLVNTAKKYLDVNKASVTVVHPSTVTEESINNNYKQSISFTGAKKVAINPETVKEYQTQNNYRVITSESKTNNVELVYKIFMEHPTENKVASLILDSLLNEGSKNKTKEEMSSSLAQEGITSGFSVSPNSFTCALGCDVNTISKGFDSIKEIINNPRFNRKDFDLAKETLKNNIINSDKSASDKLNCELFKGEISGYSKEELLNKIDNLTLDDIKKLYNEILTNGKGIVSISAPFNRKPEITSEVFSNIASLPTVKNFEINKLRQIYKPVEESKVLTDTHAKNQAEIIQAYKFPVNGNLKDSVTMNLLNIILGGNSSSRLFMDLREEQKLAYHVSSKYNRTGDMGTLRLKIKTTTENKETGETSFDNVQKSLDGFKKHIEKLKTEKVSEEELNNAKLHLKNIVLNENHSNSDKVVNLLQGATGYYGKNIDNLYFQEIDKITAQDIYNAANNILSTKPLYSIIATENTLKANEQYLKNLIS